MRFMTLLLIITLLPIHAHAACTRPEGVEGEVVYIKNTKLVQYCDGDSWIGVGWKRSPMHAAGTTGQVQFNDNNSLAASSYLFWDNTSRRLHIQGGSEWSYVSMFANNTFPHRNHFLAQRALGTPAMPAAVITNTNLGGLAIGGFDGEDYSFGWNGGAEISAYAAQDFTPTARGTHLVFQTTQDNTTMALERMRITSEGQIAIGTNAPKSRFQIGGDENGINNNRPTMTIIADNIHDGGTPLRMKSVSDTAVGIHDATDTEQFTIYTKGFQRMALQSAAPVSCTAQTHGAIALTTNATLCVCTTANAWRIANTNTNCPW